MSSLKTKWCLCLFVSEAIINSTGQHLAMEKAENTSLDEYFWLRGYLGGYKRFGKWCPTEGMGLVTDCPSCASWRYWWCDGWIIISMQYIAKVLTPTGMPSYCLLSSYGIGTQAYFMEPSSKERRHVVKPQFEVSSQHAWCHSYSRR